MITLADQCADPCSHRKNAPARARKYSIAGPILPDCHKLKQSAAHNGIVMMQIPQTCYGPQRQRDDIERASVKCAYAPGRIMQQRDDAAMRLCAYDGSVMMPLCGYAHESIERHDIMRLCAYGHMTLGAYADMRLCAYNDMMI